MILTPSPLSRSITILISCQFSHLPPLYYSAILLSKFCINVNLIEVHTLGCLVKMHFCKSGHFFLLCLPMFFLSFPWQPVYKPNVWVQVRHLCICKNVYIHMCIFQLLAAVFPSLLVLTQSLTLSYCSYIINCNRLVWPSSHLLF